jgi:hypothetical protein
MFGALYFAATLLPFVDRAWRRLDDRPAASDERSGPTRVEDHQERGFQAAAAGSDVHHGEA